MAKLTPEQQATELVLETARPGEEPSRMNALFATAHLDLVHTYLRHHPDRRVYRVEIAPGAKACGPLDMRYVDWLTAHDPTPEHAANYWAGAVGPRGVPSWEVVAEALVVIAEADPARVAAAAKQSTGVQLRLGHLFDAEVAPLEESTKGAMETPVRCPGA
jgi:hypothetical protein